MASARTCECFDCLALAGVHCTAHVACSWLVYPASASSPIEWMMKKQTSSLSMMHSPRQHASVTSCCRATADTRNSVYLKELFSAATHMPGIMSSLGSELLKAQASKAAGVPVEKVQQSMEMLEAVKGHLDYG